MEDFCYVLLIDGSVIAILLLGPNRHAGHVGYVVCNMRSNVEAKIGDTLYCKGYDHLKPVTALRISKPMVFAGVYPMDGSETTALRSAIDKLILNDASVTVVVETRYALSMT